MIPKALLDTDIISALMRSHPVATTRASAYYADHNQYTISSISRYEVLRGLKIKSAKVQLALFETFCNTNEILPITDDIIIKAADVYADLYRNGQLIGDADILIGATGLVHNLTVITNSESHFRRIRGLQVENWLK